MSADGVLENCTDVTFSAIIIFKLSFRYNNVCLNLNDDSGSELCTNKDYGFEGDDGVDLITWTLSAEKVTQGTGILSNR